MKLDWVIWGVEGSFVKLEFSDDLCIPGEELLHNTLLVEGYVKSHTYIGGFAETIFRMDLLKVSEILTDQRKTIPWVVCLVKGTQIGYDRRSVLTLKCESEFVIYASGSIEPCGVKHPEFARLKFRFKIDIERFKDSLYDLEVIAKEFNQFAI
jgi:hypothetical protein